MIGGGIVNWGLRAEVSCGRTLGEVKYPTLVGPAAGMTKEGLKLAPLTCGPGIEQLVTPIGCWTTAEGLKLAPLTCGAGIELLDWPRGCWTAGVTDRLPDLLRLLTTSGSSESCLRLPLWARGGAGGRTLSSLSTMKRDLSFPFMPVQRLRARSRSACSNRWRNPKTASTYVRKRVPLSFVPTLKIKNKKIKHT